MTVKRDGWFAHLVWARLCVTDLSVGSMYVDCFLELHVVSEMSRCTLTVILNVRSWKTRAPRCTCMSAAWTLLGIQRKGRRQAFMHRTYTIVLTYMHEYSCGHDWQSSQGLLLVFVGKCYRSSLHIVKSLFRLAKFCALHKICIRAYMRPGVQFTMNCTARRSTGRLVIHKGDYINPLSYSRHLRLQQQNHPWAFSGWIVGLITYHAAASGHHCL